MALPSYAHGSSAIPLRGETIGDNLDRIATAFPANDAVASVQQGVQAIGVPDERYFVDGWPMTVSGKVQKYKMREQSIVTLHLEAAAKIVTA